MNLRKFAMLTGAAVMLAVPAFSSANFTYDFNNVFTGSTPGGNTPWATLTGTQDGSNTDFTLSFNNNSVPAGLAATEFLKQLDITYTGGLAGTSITESEAGITGYDIGSFTDASKSFDGKIDFNTPNNGDRVMVGDTVTFTLNNTNADNFSGFLLHVNGIGEGSGKLDNAVPEPCSMAALGFGALGLLAKRRRNKK
jgi:hypothetical protein